MTRTRVLALSLIAAATAAAGTSAQQPQIQNARMETRPGASLARDAPALVASATEPIWIAWRVPVVDGNYNSCCWSTYDDWQGNRVTDHGCGIEPTTTMNGVASTPRPDFPAPTGPVKLEAGTGLIVLVRALDHHVERLRTLSDDCPMDAGGRTVYWLDGVAGDASVKYLRTLMDQPDGTTDVRRRIADNALSAIGLHRDASAEDLLIAFAHPPNDAHTRGQAVSALGRRADKRALAELTAAIEKDTDADVRRRAVVGLAQMPKDDAVPALIALARTSKDLAVRKEAMNWLQQSKDPRALAFFNEIVKRPMSR